MSDLVGQLDRYRLIRKLGSGTFGQVYLAKGRHRDKDVAIKILPSLVNEDEDLPRFLTEARIMMWLKHPHIVQILDFGIDAEKQTPLLVMEYAPNGTLRQHHPKESLVPLSTVLTYITQLAAALQAAHNDQVIHRDIKPENMLLNQRGQVLLSDFGIATMVPGSVLHSSPTFGGTVPYMAPEQAEGHPCPASDQYSLAVVVYEWLCGQRPFHGSPVQIAIQHRLKPPPSLCEQNPQISPEVEQVVFKALAKEPADRFASVEIFAQALEAACSAEHTLHITPSPEASPQRLSSESSKKPVPSEKADYLSPISGDSAVVLEAGAVTGVADLVKKGAQQPSVPTTPFPQINSPVSSVASDITPPPMLDAPDPAIGTGLSVIELPPSSWPIDSRPTAKLPDAPSAGVLVGAERSPVTQTPHAPSQRGNIGKKAVVAILIVALLLLGSGVASSIAGLQLFPFDLSRVGNSAPATITITPDSKVEQDSYVIQAVTGNANLAKRQILLRQLSFSPKEQSKVVTATGVGHVPAQAATGKLAFYNGSNQDFVVGSTTAIPGPNGISVETDGPADIPAAHLPTEGTITVNAHVTTAGASGNMAAGAINETCCASGGFIRVVSSAFTGGQDEKDYTFLQQSDVDGYVNQIKSTLSQQALSGVKGQLKPNEQLAGDPECTTQSREDQPVGDQGHDVTSANVTVDATCTGLAYDARGAQILAQDLLQRKAISDLGQAYVLAGTVVTKSTVTDVNDGVVTLQVMVSGTWSYRLNDKEKQTLASQLANKTRVAAQGYLDASKGISKAKIDIANGGDSLPDDPGQIRIIVAAASN